tara:strand:+ start:2771 stop:4078 length:1308 start_codon:yes stop_codon:yes gene_type:complete
MNIERILKKIESKDFVVGILGMGYVGLPLALRFSEVGFKVIGFDIDKKKVDSLNNSKSFIKHISDQSISEAKKNNFFVTTEMSQSNSCDALIICVPTPLNSYKEPDLSYVVDTVNSIVPFLKEGQIISLESTTYPGTTEEEILPRIEGSGLEVGKDIFLVYSPEREDPGNENFTTNTIPKILGGTTAICAEMALPLYKSAIDSVHKVSNTKTAEMTKLLENIHRAVNIGLVNEIKVVSDEMGIDIFEVIDAAATKPFGFTAFYPGPGLGGHCIPIDPFYLTWKAKEYGLHTRFIELAGEINSSMPQYVVEKLILALNSIKKSVKDSNVLILGLSYKKNVDDLRESPSLDIIERLFKLGANVAYSDPYFDVFPKMRNYNFDLTSVVLNKKNLKNFDAVVLATDHDSFNYESIYSNSNLIIDTRGVFNSRTDKIFKA